MKNDDANKKLYIGVSRLNRIAASCGVIAKITMEVIDIPIENAISIKLENGIASDTNEILSEIPLNTIDVVFPSSCEAPSILQEQNLTASGVTLAWNNTGAEAYQLGGRRVGGTAKTFPETTETSRTFTSGLQSSTCYEWTVRAKCNGVWTDWYFPLASFCTGAGKNGETYSEANDPFFTNETPSFANVVLYPNPAKETAFLALESGFENTIEVLVFDILGKKVRTQKENLQTGSNTLNINIDDFETGIYFVEINDGFEKKVMKLNIF